jgi:hypothetical protein
MLGVSESIFSVDRTSPWAEVHKGMSGKGCMMGTATRQKKQLTTQLSVGISGAGQLPGGRACNQNPAVVTAVIGVKKKKREREKEKGKKNPSSA